MTVSNCKPECNVLHSSPLPPLGSAAVGLCCGPARQCSPALCLTRPLAARGIAQLRARASGHSWAGGFAPCRVPGSPSLPLPRLLCVWEQDPTCQTSASAHRGGPWQLPLTRSPAAAVSLPLAMHGSSPPDSPEPSNRSPSRYKMSLMWIHAPRVQLHRLGSAGALAGPVPPCLLVAAH